MRVIAGTLKGRRYDPPAGLGIRPTTDRAREALFNILQHRFEIEGARVLDLFAGSGGVSLEFVSRGAAQVTAVEMSRKVVAYLQTLVQQMAPDQVQVVQADALQFVQGTPTAYDYVFLDPPYALPDKAGLVRTLFERGWVAAGGQVLLEHPNSEQHARLPQFVERREYGLSVFSFFAHVAS